MYPKITVVVGEPIYPESAGNKENMCDEAYKFMSETAKREGSYAYIEYKKREDSGN